MNTMKRMERVFIWVNAFSANWVENVDLRVKKRVKVGGGTFYIEIIFLFSWLKAL